MLITGFLDLVELGHTMLEFEQTAACEQPVRILLGFPPAEYQPQVLMHTPITALPDELVSDLMDQGISLRNASWLLGLKHALDSGKLKVRFSRNQHCKLYCATQVTSNSDRVAFNGSANLTRLGLSRRLGEILIEHVEGLPELPDILDEAEQFWSNGEDFNPELAEILSRLLRITTWKESLCAALEPMLSPRLADTVLESLNIDIDSVWYHQRVSAQMLIQLLQEHGTAILANVLGSGKTKTACLTMAFIEELCLQNLVPRSLAGVVITPSNPVIMENWTLQLEEHGLDHKVISRGISSAGPIKSTTNYPRLVKLLINGRFVVIDEGQLFVNPTTNCSSTVRDRNSLYTLFLTATPLKGSIRDGYLLLEGLIGLDNLPRELLTVFEPLREKCQALEARGAERLVNALTLLPESTRAPLVRELYAFLHTLTVRMTPDQIEKYIALYPESYRKPDGSLFRYPEIKTDFIPPTKERRQLELAITLGIRTLASQMSFIGNQLKICVDGFVNPSRAIGREINDLVPITHEVFLSKVGEGLKRYQRMWEIGFINYVTQSFSECSFAGLELLLGAKWAQKEPAAKKGHYLGRLLEQRQQSGKHAGTKARWQGYLNEYCRTHPRLSKQNKASLQAELDSDLALLSRIVELLKYYQQAWDNILWSSIEQALGSDETFALVFANSPVAQAYWADYANQNDPARKHLYVSGSSDAHLLKAFDAHQPKPSIAHVCWLTNALTEGYNAHRAEVVLNLSISGSVNVTGQRNGRIYRLDSPQDIITIRYLRPVSLGVKRMGRLSHAAAFVDITLGPVCEWPLEVEALGFDDLMNLLIGPVKELSAIEKINASQLNQCQLYFDDACDELLASPVGKAVAPQLSKIRKAMEKEYLQRDVLRAVLLDLPPRAADTAKMKKEMRKLIRDGSSAIVLPAQQQLAAQQSAYSGLANLITGHPLSDEQPHSGLVEFSLFQKLEKYVRQHRVYMQLSRVNASRNWCLLSLEIPSEGRNVPRLVIVTAGQVMVRVNEIGSFLKYTLDNVPDVALDWSQKHFDQIQRAWDKALASLSVMTHKEANVLFEMRTLVESFLASIQTHPLSDFVSKLSPARQQQLANIDLGAVLDKGLDWLDDRALRKYWLNDDALPVPSPGALATEFWSMSQELHQKAKKVWSELRHKNKLPPQLPGARRAHKRNWQIEEALALYHSPAGEAFLPELLYILIKILQQAKPVINKPHLIAGILGAVD
ncbi:hypothetical protein [Vibrio natriegens]|uniref:hypothetical protein n=1 Tax=Vibrio natriegens TaxID=691 RepID=UPI0012DB0173|nr:hypothetical protein [Vibrio natriegens]